MNRADIDARMQKILSQMVPLVVPMSARPKQNGVSSWILDHFRPRPADRADMAHAAGSPALARVMPQTTSRRAPAMSSTKMKYRDLLLHPCQLPITQLGGQ